VTSDAVPARVLERFEVGDEVGRGGTGVLYRATEIDTGIPGVLKILHAEVISPRERMRMTRDLARQASLSNIHLAVPVATGEADGRVWVFRRWIEGESVRDRLDREGALEQGLALAIVGQVASALDELHRTGLLHRDVKPEHILLHPAGSVVLIDAGVTSVIPDTGMLEVRGTPAYVSPEHATGKVVSFRSDLYGLGCVLHELLTGAPPFGGETSSEVLAAHSDEPPPPAPEGLPDKIESLLASLLAKNPRERPFSASNVAKVLRPFVPQELRARPSSVGVTGYHPTTLSGTGAAPREPVDETPASSTGPEPAADAGARAKSLPPPPPPEAGARAKSLPPPPPPPDAGGRAKSLPPPPPIPGGPARSRARGDATEPLSLAQILSAERADPTQEVTGSQILVGSESTQPVALEQIVAEETPPARSVPPPAPTTPTRPIEPVGGWPSPDKTQPMTAVPVAPSARRGPLPRKLAVGGAVALAALLGIFALSSGDEVPEPTRTASAPTTSGAPATPTTPSTAPGSERAEAPGVGDDPTPVTADEVEAETAPVPVAEAEDAPEADGVDPEADAADAADPDAADAEAEVAEEGEIEEAPAQGRSARRARRARRPSGAGAASARREGDAHLRAGRNRQAEAAFRRAVRANPRDAQAWVGLGAAQIRQGNARGAAQAYQRAVRLSPNNSNYFTYLGRAHARSGNRSAARQAYRRALALNPRNRAARRGLDRL